MIHAMNVALVSFFKELIHVFHTSRRYTMYNVYVYISILIFTHIHGMSCVMNFD